MNQAELEQEITDSGRNRAVRAMENNEEAGRGYSNPYAQAVYRRFVLPLARVIESDLNAKVPGRRQAHVALLTGIDAEAVAFIAVRNTLGTLLGGPNAEKGSKLMHGVGNAVYHEYMLSHFEHVQPDLFYTLINDFERRRSKDERHRVTVFKMQARANGIEWNEWSIGAKEQVGAYLLEQLDALGMVELEKVRRKVGVGFKSDTVILLTPETADLISNIREFVSETTPYYLPCVEPPKDWVAINDGGWHTPALRRVQPYCVSVRRGAIEAFSDVKMPKVLSGINALQKVRWRVNTVVLDAVLEIAKHFDMEEILCQAEIPKPEKPTFLFDGMQKEQMDQEQLKEFIQWKRLMAEWHTDMRSRGTKFGRFYAATRVAHKMRFYPNLYFVYNADFRGRLYAQTTGINPQGSDMQKALLHFAEGKPIATKAAEKWFLAHGANKFGYDKVPLEGRAQWVRDRKPMLLRMAADPISYNEWQEADKPLQFLAWVFEYAQWCANPSGFLSHLPIGQDGSCNGLQNFSALLLDEIGGKATNLVPNKMPNDIYAMVAARTTELLRAMPDDEEGYKEKWLAHGINRTLVKRSVMTLPYGSTRFSSVDFIVGDYLKAGKATEFSKEEYGKAARFLSFPVWEAIGDVVVKAREAMSWLQQAANTIIRGGESSIRWVTPSGFPVLQQYYKMQEHRINTRLCGGTKIVCYSDTEEPHRVHHRNGIAPNFVHSLDASHMLLTTLAAVSQGVHSLAMIHDDYGTHAADSERLAICIREQFVSMYSTFLPLEEFRNRYELFDLPELPAKGKLDLNEVLKSEFFFS